MTTILKRKVHGVGINEKINIDIDPDDSTTQTTYNVRKRIYHEAIVETPVISRVLSDTGIGRITILNGGEDYELLMAISQSNYEKVKNHPFLTVIGHFTRKKSSAKLITSLNQEIDLTAQGWNSISESN